MILEKLSMLHDVQLQPSIERTDCFGNENYIYPLSGRKCPMWGLEVPQPPRYPLYDFGRQVNEGIFYQRRADSGLAIAFLGSDAGKKPCGLVLGPCHLDESSSYHMRP